MKITLLFFIIFTLIAVWPFHADCSPSKRDVSPIVSTQWLLENLDADDLVLLDVRDPETYTKGHIPDSVNFPGLGNFYINLFSLETPWMEIPDQTALASTIGKAGITKDSVVVVIGRTAGPMAEYAVADAARVAMTLLYAGVKNAAVLDGGYDKWAFEKKTTSTRPAEAVAKPFSSDVNKTMIADKTYVEKKIGTSTLIDARDSDAYFGLTQAPWEKKPGHIPSARSLPAPWLWNFKKDKSGLTVFGTYKDNSTIMEMVSAVAGSDLNQEMIVYCGVGGYGSAMYYVLTQIAGYRNVKLFDGSMQVWTEDPKALVVKYRYQ